MTIGPHAGRHYSLDSTNETTLGRGDDCTITLADPLCSRRHAVISCHDREWRVRDAGSRNGAFVNEQKIDDAVLSEGHNLRLGTCEFSFHQSEQPPTSSTGPISGDKMVRNTLVGDFIPSEFALSAIHNADQAQDLLLLYQLSIRLLGCADPQEVIRESLEL
ncbi:MAG TPA: FHA domain-containing protein, partial [Pirellulales bacterium]